MKLKKSDFNQVLDIAIKKSLKKSIDDDLFFCDLVVEELSNVTKLDSTDFFNEYGIGKTEIAEAIKKGLLNILKVGISSLEMENGNSYYERLHCVISNDIIYGNDVLRKNIDMTKWKFPLQKIA